MPQRYFGLSRPEVLVAASPSSHSNSPIYSPRVEWIVLAGHLEPTAAIE